MGLDQAWAALRARGDSCAAESNSRGLPWNGNRDGTSRWNFSWSVVPGRLSAAVAAAADTALETPADTDRDCSRIRSAPGTNAPPLFTVTSVKRAIARDRRRGSEASHLHPEGVPLSRAYLYRRAISTRTESEVRSDEVCALVMIVNINLDVHEDIDRFTKFFYFHVSTI